MIGKQPTDDRANCETTDHRTNIIVIIPSFVPPLVMVVAAMMARTPMTFAMFMALPSSVTAFVLPWIGGSCNRHASR